MAVSMITRKSYPIACPLAGSGKSPACGGVEAICRRYGPNDKARCCINRYLAGDLSSNTDG